MGSCTVGEWAINPQSPRLVCGEAFFIMNINEFETDMHKRQPKLTHTQNDHLEFGVSMATIYNKNALDLPGLLDACWVPCGCILSILVG